ncbi:ABC transporter permease [Tumebacillus lipolyticus]|uniref:ABC transporter permease n=1 Tax=Tumebacillus lipolyticus TaxID=1280370 RepID=A0ABW4ZT30_9BACL
MRKLLKVIRFEGLLLLRNRVAISFLILYALFWAGAIGYYVMAEVPEPRAGYFYEMLFRQYTLWVLLIVSGWAGVHLARKDRVSGFEQLFLAWNVKNDVWLFGKWIVLQSYVGVITSITLIVCGSWFGLGSYGLLDWFQHMIYVLLNVGGGMLFYSSLGFLLGHAMRSRFVYLLLTALWGVMVWAQLNITGVSSWNPKWRLLAPYDSVYYFSPFEDVFELAGRFPEVWVHQTAAILTGVCFLLLLLSVYRIFRMEVWERRRGWSMLLVVFIAGTTLATFRYEAFEEKMKSHREFVEERMVEEDTGSFVAGMNDRADTSFTMDRTNLEVRLFGGDQIKAKAMLTVTYHGKERTKRLDLTLLGSLKIADLVAENAGEIEWEQEGDQIAVMFPEPIAAEQPLHLTLQYEGSIQQTSDDLMAESSFAEPDRINLSKSSGWYPLIGKRSLWKAYAHNGRYFNAVLYKVSEREPSPTDFTVKIESEMPTKNPLVMSIAQQDEMTFSGRSTDLILLSGNLTERSVSGIRVVAHPDLIELAVKRVEEKVSGWKFLEQWLGDELVPQTVFVISAPGFADPVYDDPLVQKWGAWALRIKEENYYYKTDYLVQLPFANGMSWGEISKPAYDRDLFVQAMKWVVRNHFQDRVTHTHFADFYRESSYWTSTSASGSQDNAVLRERVEKLIDVLGEYDIKDRTEFKRVVSFLYKQFDRSKTPDEFDLEEALKLYRQTEEL